MFANAANLPAYRSQIANTMTAGPAPSEAALRVLTERPGVVDYCADDVALEGYADGDTVGDWVARRGGLTASATGTPTYTAPDSDLGVPSVAYGASSAGHETPATIDWSAYDEATILGVHYTESVSGVSRGMSLAAGTSDIASDGGVGTYRVNGNITGLHRAAGEAFILERDATADPFLAVTVVTHDFNAAASAEIEIFVNGIEEEGSTTGSSNAGAVWQSNLRARLGASNATAGGDGLDGRLARFIALPYALTAAQAVQASTLLQITARVD